MGQFQILLFQRNVNCVSEHQLPGPNQLSDYDHYSNYKWVAARQTKSVNINTDGNGLFVYDFGETSVQLSAHTTTLARVESSIAKSEESSTSPASSLYHSSLLSLSHNAVEVTSAAETSSDHYWVEYETQPVSDFITITSNYSSSSLPTESFSVILPHNSSEISLEIPLKSHQLIWKLPRLNFKLLLLHQHTQSKTKLLLNILCCKLLRCLLAII